jgi:hypothetical protein
MTSTLPSLLLGALFGAVFALIGSVVVQVVVVPRVERRNRRETRFEADLLDLGAALTTDVSRHEQALKRAVTEFFAESGTAQAAADAAREWDQFAQRVDWLVQRVLGFRRDDDLSRAYESWQREAERFSSFTWASVEGVAWEEWPEADVRDLVWGASDGEFDERQQVVGCVERLLRV